MIKYLVIENHKYRIVKRSLNNLYVNIKNYQTYCANCSKSIVETLMTIIIFSLL